MKELSVVIVTYNSEPDIYGCLDALFAKNDLGEGLEVIVVDNNSRDYAHMRDELARLYGQRVTVVQNTRNGGYGQGNNIGIRQASAPIIMIMNPDVRMETTGLKTIVQAFERDAKMAMYGMKQLTMSGKRSLSFAYTNYCSPVLRSIGTFIANKYDRYDEKKMCFAGACFCIRKAMFEQVGLFDEHIFLFGEENDIHYRLRTQVPSAHFFYNPSIIYRHDCEDREFSEKSYLLQLESNCYVISKQHRTPQRYLNIEERTLQLLRIIKILTGTTGNLDIVNKKIALVRSYSPC